MEKRKVIVLQDLSSYDIGIKSNWKLLDRLHLHPCENMVRRLVSSPLAGCKCLIDEPPSVVRLHFLEIVPSTFNDHWPALATYKTSLESL